MCEETNTNIEKIDINEFDILGRDKFVANCKLLIDSIFETTKSAFIMIDGEWGVGKTFVMNMLDKKLGDSYNIIKYNCWENSYYNDPLEAILSVMLDYIDENSLWSNANKEKFRALSMIALNLLSLGSVGILNKVAEDAIEYIGEDKNSIYTVIQEVKDYINSNEEKIIILVDEIDRCLPQYGVKTLERLYLLFKDAPNFVIVIANDKSKMEISIEKAFGYKSIDNYLEKFIDYVLKITNEGYNDIWDHPLVIHGCIKYFFFDYIYEKKSEEIHASILIYVIFGYLIATKTMRYIEKLAKKRENIHRIVFKNKENVPLYIYIIELLMVEFSRKMDEFTIDNIMDYIKNTNFKNIPSFFDVAFNNANDNNFYSTNKKIQWIELWKNKCSLKDEQNVILFFELVNDIIQKKINMFNTNISYATNFFSSHMFAIRDLAFNTDDIYNFNKVIDKKYFDISSYLYDLNDFYWFSVFIEQI